MDWSEYVSSKTQGLNQADVALQTGVHQSTVSRWVKGGQPPSAQTAIDFARAVGDSPIAALIACGLIRPDEARKVVQLGASAGDLETRDLLLELGRRLGVDLTIRERRGAG